MTKLVLLGGGHAHAVVLRSFQNFVSKNLDVVLVSETPKHTYSGMVPGVIAGHYAVDEAQIDLARLAQGAGAAFVQARAERIDASGKRVLLANGEAIGYDVASLNLGSTTSGSNPVKPFEPFFARWQQLLQGAPAPRVAVVGAGAAGVELAMAMRYALSRRGGGSVELYSDRFAFPAALGARIRHALDRRSIPLRLGQEPAAGFDGVFFATGPNAPPLLRASGFETDAAGFIGVDAHLRSLSHSNVFAAGDAAALPGAGAPKSGVYAVRQGPVLAANLKRAVRGMALREYRPQHASLSLISCGDRYAIASRGSWSAEGAWAWRWKDWIDRRWITGFR